MNTKKLLSLWGLKWNPFSPELPSEGLLVTAQIDHFAWRVEQLVQEGGFALITGESGTGKSVALRIVAERLAALRDVVVGVLQRPQSKTAEFYRELGDLFSVTLRNAANRLRSQVGVGKFFFRGRTPMFNLQAASGRANSAILGFGRSGGGDPFTAARATRLNIPVRRGW